MHCNYHPAVEPQGRSSKRRRNYVILVCLNGSFRRETVRKCDPCAGSDTLSSLKGNPLAKLVSLTISKPLFNKAYKGGKLRTHYKTHVHT